MLRHRRRARSTRAANWAFSVRPSIIPTSSSPALSAMARPKPARLLRPGIPTSSLIRRAAARSCISTGQDCQPDNSGAHGRCRAGEAIHRLWLRAVLRRMQRAARHAWQDGRCVRSSVRPHQPDSAGSACAGLVRRAYDLADDRAQEAEGLDRAERGRRQEGRGFLALAPGAGGECPRRRGASPRARRLDAELRARNAVRPRRAADAGARRIGAGGQPPHGRHALCQWRAAAQGARAAGLEELRARSAAPGAARRRRRRA